MLIETRPCTERDTLFSADESIATVHSITSELNLSMFTSGEAHSNVWFLANTKVPSGCRLSGAWNTFTEWKV